MRSTDTPARDSKAIVIAVVLAVFVLYWNLESLLVLVPGYRGLFDSFGYQVPRSLLSLTEMAVVLAAVCWLHRVEPSQGAHELGLRKPVLMPLGLGLLAAAPMWIIFAVSQPLSTDPVAELAYLSFLSPLAEEVVYRGFLFGQLWRHGGWGLWPSIAVSSLAFGYGHTAGTGSLLQGVGMLLLTGLGAAVFAWLYTRWGTLVAPLALHVMMNLSWSLWQVGDSALAGWVPFALQLTTVLLAIVLTVVAGRWGWIDETRASV